MFVCLLFADNNNKHTAEFTGDFFFGFPTRFCAQCFVGQTIDARCNPKLP